MKRLVLTLGVLVTPLGCGSEWQRSDDAFLRECWGAVPLPDGAYRLRFDGLMTAAVEGGIFARSEACPDHRIRFARLDAAPRRQIDPLWQQAWTAGGLGLGITGTAELVPLERVHEHYLRVRVRALSELSPMGGEETRQFIDRFSIG